MFRVDEHAPSKGITSYKLCVAKKAFSLRVRAIIIPTCLPRLKDKLYLRLGLFISSLQCNRSTKIPEAIVFQLVKQARRSVLLRPSNLLLPTDDVVECYNVLTWFSITYHGGTKCFLPSIENTSEVLFVSCRIESCLVHHAHLT